MKVFDSIWDSMWVFLFGNQITLHTPLRRINDFELQKILKLTKKWCIKNFGLSHNNPKAKIYMTKQIYGQVCYGEYNPDSNVIYIYSNNCEDIKCLIKTFIHEYVHHLQPVKNSYKKLLESHGYKKHPMEIEARNMESYYIYVWEDIKNKL